MTHLTEETILAVRDREHVTDEALAHVARCARCAEALKDARARAQAVEQALAALTRPLRVEKPRSAQGGERGDMAGATPLGREGRDDERGAGALGGVVPTGRVRRVAAGGSAPGRPRRSPVRGAVRGSSRLPWWLGRAAALVLLGAGALSALPGPFNGWIPRMFSEAPAAQMPTEPAARPADQVGGRMAVAAGPLVVHLEMVPPGTLIEVRRGIGANAGVFADAGSEFSYGSGEVRASIVAGPVTVELPDGVVPATLIVNGGTYLVVRASGMEVSGPRAAAAAEENLVTFQVPD